MSLSMFSVSIYLLQIQMPVSEVCANSLFVSAGLTYKSWLKILLAMAYKPDTSK